MLYILRAAMLHM